jgi:hypothetical protein
MSKLSEDVNCTETLPIHLVFREEMLRTKWHADDDNLQKEMPTKGEGLLQVTSKLR